MRRVRSNRRRWRCYGRAGLLQRVPASHHNAWCRSRFALRIVFGFGATAFDCWGERIAITEDKPGRRDSQGATTLTVANCDGRPSRTTPPQKSCGAARPASRVCCPWTSWYAATALKTACSRARLDGTMSGRACRGSDQRSWRITSSEGVLRRLRTSCMRHATVVFRETPSCSARFAVAQAFAGDQHDGGAQLRIELAENAREPEVLHRIGCFARGLAAAEPPGQA